MPQMEVGRWNFQVVWLPDGCIFALGGFSAGWLRSVEMLHRAWAFDGNTTDQWRRCSDMLVERSNFAAVLLHNEMVLVAGGQKPSGNWHESVELFIPPAAYDLHALGQWTNLQPMHFTPRSTCTGVYLDGIVIIFGKIPSLPLTNFLVATKQVLTNQFDI